MNIVYFSPIAYDDLKQRPQYIAEGLAKEHYVYYIEPTIRRTSCILGRGQEYKGRRHNVMPNLEVVRCDGTWVLPFRLNVYDFLGLNGIAERKYLQKVIDDADLIIVAYEGWMNVLAEVKGKKIIYDKMDDNVQLAPSKQVKKYLQRCEKHLLKRIQHMIVTAEKFQQDYKEKVKQIYYIPNGVDLECDRILDIFPKDDKVVYGYIGMIAEWFDMEVIKEISKKKNNKVVLVGPCNIETYEAENVVYVGKVPKTEVAKWIQSFDVCLYPFKKSGLLDTINPVKIYEYLALDKPVIAVDSLETRKFGDYIYRYKDVNELKALCEKKLENPFCDKTECKKFVDANSWNNRVEQILRILEEI